MIYRPGSTSLPINPESRNEGSVCPASKSARAGGCREIQEGWLVVTDGRVGQVVALYVVGGTRRPVAFGVVWDRMALLWRKGRIETT